MDGLLPSRSDPVGVDTAPGDVIDVELVVPAERTGGIGVYIAEHDEGILVAGVLPGTPAWEAGLRDGDVIVEVDGLATAALELEEFQQVMTGPEDTEVEFVVSLPGDTGDSLMTVTATRRYLDRSLLGG
jgi:carboxyl-terminal processing protease